LGTLADEFEQTQSPKTNNPDELRDFYIRANDFPLRKELSALYAKLHEPALAIGDVQTVILDALRKAAVRDSGARFVLERFESLSDPLASLPEMISLLEGLVGEPSSAPKTS